MDYRPPGSSIHGIFQTRVLEWGAIAFSDTKIRLTIFFAAEDGEALYSQQKQDQRLTEAQIKNSLLQIRLKLKKVGKPIGH